MNNSYDIDSLSQNQSDKPTGLDIIMDVNSRAILWSNGICNFYSNDDQFINAISNNNYKHFVMKVWMSSNDKNIESLILNINPKIIWKKYEGERLSEKNNSQKSSEKSSGKKCLCLIS